MSTFKHFLSFNRVRTALEPLLLLLFCGLLWAWFGQGFSLPSQQAQSAFEQTVWMGRIQLPTTPAAYTPSLCQHALTAPPAQSTQNALAVACAYLAPSSANLGTISAYQTEQDRQFEQLQMVFAQLYAQDLPYISNQQTALVDAVSEPASESESANNNLVADNSSRRDQFLTALHQQGVGATGSLFLYCAWQLSTPAALNNSQYSVLLRAELLHGGHAPYQAFNDRLNIQPEQNIGAVLLPNQWTSSSPTVQQNCADLALSPQQLYVRAQQQLEFFYAQQQAYRKTKLMDQLSFSAHYYFIALAVLGYLCLCLARLPLHIFARAALLCSLWAVAHLAVSRLYVGLLPPVFGNTLYGFLLLAVSAALWQHRHYPRLPQRLQASSALAYPLVVLLLGVGYFILLDWSIWGGYNAKRFVAVNQSVFLFHFFLILSLSSLWFTPLFVGLNRLKTLMYWLPKQMQRLQQATHASPRRATLFDHAPSKRQLWRRFLLQVLLGVLALVAVALLMSGKPHITAELFRTGFMLLVAYLISQRTAQEQRQLFSPALSGLLFFAAIVVLLQVATADLGPAMVLSYVLLLLLLVQVLFYYWQQPQRAHSKPLQVAASVLLLACVTIASAMQVFQWVSTHVGGERSRERVLSMAQPFHSSNDQRAMLLYFVQSVPQEGYGLNHTPWQGVGRGVPAQTQSDYMPMALYAVLGQAWLAALLTAYAVLLGGLLQGLRARSGSRSLATMTPVQQQQQTTMAFYGWLTLLWVLFTVVQVALTFSGNFGLTPLTGISLPLFSFGQLGLYAQALVLGLIIQRLVPPRPTTTLFKPTF